MVRIAWINLPNGKHVEIALTYIYGIGKSRAQEVLKKVWIVFYKKNWNFIRNWFG